MLRRRGAWLAVGLVLLGVGWMFATPEWQSPDEPAQYLSLDPPMGCVGEVDLAGLAG